MQRQVLLHVRGTSIALDRDDSGFVLPKSRILTIFLSLLGQGPSWDGQSGVHTHMTNTRITDPEILERR